MIKQQHADHLGSDSTLFVSRRQRAFTLIEVMMALAIVSILLLLAAPRFFGQLEKSREVTLRENLKVMRSAIDQYRADAGVYPESLAQLVDKKYLKSIPTDPYIETADRWATLPPGAGEQGTVADVKTGAPGSARDGKPLSEL